MPPRDDLARTLAEISSRLLSHPGREPTARDVVALAVARVPGVEFASLTASSRGGREHVTEASSGPVANTCDELQYSLGDGPCLAAARGGGVIAVADVLDEPRWRQWGTGVASATGVRSTLSLGLVEDDHGVGSLNLYSTEPAGVTGPETLAPAALFAQHVAAALAVAGRLSGLEAALESRHSIGIAQGILMERFGLSVDGAFHVLRRYSSTTNVRLRDVAHQLATTGQLPGDPVRPDSS